MKKKGRWQVEIGETIKTEKSHKAQASFLIIVIIINPWVLSLFHQSGNYSSLPFLLKSSQEHQQQHYHHRDCYCGGAALGNIQIVYQSTQAPSNSALISRRDVALASVSIPLGFLLFPTASEARERRNRRVIPSEDYTTTADGLKYYDLIVGKGVEAEKNSTAQVHFDCIYRGVTALSSRESKLLAGNRIIAQPYEFKVGSLPGKERKRDFVDNANGLFSAQAAPKPPPAIYSITEGMRVGGERRVIVPLELGYGQKGMNEIPRGATFELNVQLLKVVQTEEVK